MEYIDISININKHTPIWPNGKKPKISYYKKFDKDNVNTSYIEMDSHAGTHIDAPKHFIKNGKSIEDIPLEKFIGPVYIIEINNKVINKHHIEKKSNILSNYKKIIFKTKNSNLYNKKFYKDYVALNIKATKEIIKFDLDLIGIDYLSIQKYGEKYNEVHESLLKNDILILEGLDLRNVIEGKYKLYAFPIKIGNIDASPVRAILEKGD